MRMGTHILVNLYGCPRNKLEKSSVVVKLLKDIVKEAKLTPVGKIASHQFKPFGVTSVVLLAESHISIHTWPEYNSVAVDIFCCGKSENAERAFKSLIKKFKPKKYDRKRVER